MKKTAQDHIPPEWLAEYDTGIYRDEPKRVFPLNAWKKLEAFRRRTEAEDKEFFDLDRLLATAEQFATNILL